MAGFVALREVCALAVQRGALWAGWAPACKMRRSPYGKGLNCARLDNHWGLHHTR